MKKKRLSARGGVVTVSLSGIKNSGFVSIVFFNDEQKEIHREKVSGVPSFSFKMEKAEGLYTLQILNDKTALIYEEQFLVKSTVDGTHINAKGELIFSKSEFQD